MFLLVWWVEAKWLLRAYNISNVIHDSTKNITKIIILCEIAGVDGKG